MPYFRDYAGSLITNELDLARDVRCVQGETIPAATWHYVAHTGGRKYAYCARHWLDEVDADIPEGMRLFVCRVCGRDGVEEAGAGAPDLCPTCFEHRLHLSLIDAAIAVGMPPDDARAMGDRLSTQIREACHVSVGAGAG